MPIKILIADDHRLFREGLVNLLSQAPDIQVLGQSEDGQDIIQKAELLKPDIILMDITMPGLNGVEATGILKRTHPEIKIIALSMHSDNQYIKQILSQGAVGYLVKNCTYDQLIHAINLVYSGKKYLCEEIAETLIGDYLEIKKDNLLSDPNLTKRELEVLNLIAKGIPTREISEMLFISIKTVGSHKQKILEKLNLRTNADLIKYAIKKGMTSIE